MKKILFIFSLILILTGCSQIKNFCSSIDCIWAFKGTEAHELSKAVMFQDVSKIKKICKKNPNLMYIEDKNLHYTLLHFAVKLNKYKSAKTLLEVGMSPDVQSSVTGETPLFLTVKHSCIDIKFMKLLAKYGANPELETKAVKNHVFTDGRTPLMQLPTMYVPEQKLNLEKAKFLIESLNANVNAKDIDGRTAAIQALHVKDVKMSYYFIVELKADVTQPYYSPDYVVLKGEEKKQFLPVSILKDWWNYPHDSEEYKLKLEIIKEFERQGVDYNSVEPFSSFEINKNQQLNLTTLTKPKELAEKASVMERNLENLPIIKKAAIYDYDEDTAYSNTSFEIELLLKNGDNIGLHGVKSDLTFRKDRHAGIIRINKTDFDYRRLFAGTWPGIPCIDLAEVLGKKKYLNVESFLNDYNIIKTFLLDTPYGTKTGFSSSEATFYNHNGTDFLRY